ncbi:hypothetical protein CcCBS67573_g10325 [Chytriomyces confervae]|uniref:Poly(A) RNA polymerase mitochondrial-like central palm domain-containing protein n=1 Tax=Chytriomyces confervae TaxID=246404 RepID=A0A507D4F5_9FUNG|nr:hypothetical protein CcCBS67573_g10325 [Chytriomyces confervae]
MAFTKRRVYWSLFLTLPVDADLLRLLFFDFWGLALDLSGTSDGTANFTLIDGFKVRIDCEDMFGARSVRRCPSILLPQLFLDATDIELLGTDSFPLRVCVDAVAITSKKVGKMEAYSCASLLQLLKGNFISAVTMDQVPTNLLLLSKYPFSYQIVQLSTGKKAIVASFGELQVAVVHLTSDNAGSKSRLRCNRFRTLVEFLRGGVMGNFNMESKSALEAAFVEAGFQDGWTCTQPAGADGVTYHSIRNSLAAQVSRRGVVLRMDRVLVRLRDWDVGKSLIVGRGLEEDVSDYYGVACVLNRACANASAEDGSVQIARSYEEVEKDCAADAPVSKFLLSQNALPTKTSFATRVAALSALQDIFAKAFYPSPFYMTPVGSFTLGTVSPTSDLDILCLGLIHRRDLFSILRGTDTEEREPFSFPEQCCLIRILADTKIPILELSIHGIHVDVQNSLSRTNSALLASYTDAQLIQHPVPDAYKARSVSPRAY